MMGLAISEPQLVARALGGRYIKPVHKMNGGNQLQRMTCHRQLDYTKNRRASKPKAAFPAGEERLGQATGFRRRFLNFKLFCTRKG